MKILRLINFQNYLRANFKINRFADNFLTMSIIKLNSLLAKTDHLASSFREGIKDYVGFFDKSQGAFKGQKKTYAAKVGTIDNPSERSTKLVVTTVDSKLEWFEESCKDYVDALFSVERTNASGTAQGELVVDGKSWGWLTSLELLRLKSLLENSDLKKMYETIPVRTEDETWAPATDENFVGPGVLQTAMIKSVVKTTLKEPYILQDPNLANIDGAKYMPQTVAREVILELGDSTYQKFSGEWTHRQRAELLRRHHVLLTAVVVALKESNEADSVKSSLTSEKIFNYLHRGHKKD